MEMQFVFREVGTDIMYDFQEFYALKCGNIIC
jgi:hypothetical protein